MLKISIKTDFKDLQRQLSRLSDDMQKKVVPAALNKVTAKAKTEMTRAVSSEFNIQQAEVRKNLKITKAGKKYDRWIAVLDPFASPRKRGYGMNMIRFVEKRVTLAEARRRAKDGTIDRLRFKIKKIGGTKTIRGAFIATNRKTNGTAVFVRDEGRYIEDRVNRKGNSKHAQKLKAMTTVDVAQMFNTTRIRGRVEQRIRQELAVEFDRAIKAALAGKI